MAMETSHTEASTNVKTLITSKVLSVGVLGAMLILAANLISHNVTARQESWNQIRQGITASWSGPQDIVGPLLMVPIKFSNKAEESRRNQSSIAWFLPDQLAVDGAINTELLHHGICNTSVYTADLKIDGSFTSDISAVLAQFSARPQWDKAKMVLGVADLRGIRNAVFLDWGKNKLAMEPGSGDEGFKGGALDAKLEGEPRGSTLFSLTLKVRGSQQIDFIPFGRTTTLNLKSSWPSPEFNGPFFPDSKEVSANGFRASWKILQINRDIPQF